MCVCVTLLHDVCVLCVTVTLCVCVCVCVCVSTIRVLEVSLGLAPLIHLTCSAVPALPVCDLSQFLFKPLCLLLSALPLLLGTLFLSLILSFTLPLFVGALSFTLLVLVGALSFSVFPGPNKLFLLKEGLIF